MIKGDMAMTSTFRPVVTATKGTPCGFTYQGSKCHGDSPAVHVLTMTLPVAKAGTALCAYHSPFDPTDEERDAVGLVKMTKGEAGAIVLAERAEARKADAIKTHKLSAPMIGVLTEVSASRGLVGAWAMRNVVVTGVDRATMRTVAALRSRGLIDAQSNDGNQSGTGGLTDYVLTEAGYSVAEAIGCPVVDLPTVPEVIATVVAVHDRADCETGCEVIIARGMAMLPAGGDVCYGCGSIFTRPSGQEHPALYVISDAVSVRNQTKGN